jgi:hypothetical protein
MFLCFVDHCENHVSVLQKVRWVVVIRAECDETRDQPMRAYSAPHSTVRSERLVTIRCPCTLSRTRGLGPGFSPLAAPPPDLSPRSVLLRQVKKGRGSGGWPVGKEGWTPSPRRQRRALFSSGHVLLAAWHGKKNWCSRARLQAAPDACHVCRFLHHERYVETTTLSWYSQRAK